MSIHDDFGYAPEDSGAEYEEAVKELKRLGCAAEHARRILPAHIFHERFRKWRMKVEPFFRDTVDEMPLCNHLKQFANYTGYPPDWCWRRMAAQMNAFWLCEEYDHNENICYFANREGISTDSIERMLANPSLYDTDHITPMSEFREQGFLPGDEPHSLENLQCVCLVCHAAKHGNIEEQPRFKKFVAKLKESQ